MNFTNPGAISHNEVRNPQWDNQWAMRGVSAVCHGMLTAVPDAHT